MAQPKILIAPLDWGLGHATRCIPLIRELQNNYEVILCGNGAGLKLLAQEFPQAIQEELPPLDIRYSRSAFFLPLLLLAQIPRFLKWIMQEKQAVKRLVKKHQVQAIISDNRFVFRHPKVLSIYMTHQLNIQPANQNLLQKIGAKIAHHIHKSFYKKFDQIWVPDFQSTPGLAGSLSHPAPKIPTHYLGSLSRFENFAPSISKDAEQSLPLVLLSGPEPQRSLLEELVITTMKKNQQAYILVRGLPNVKTPPSTDEFCHEAFNHLETSPLAEQIQQAPWVLCRSGYSTLMDLCCFEKKAILVPTPGQSEQVYLAQTLADSQICPYLDQKEIPQKLLAQVQQLKDYKGLCFPSEKLPPLHELISQGSHYE